MSKENETPCFICFPFLLSRLQPTCRHNPRDSPGNNQVNAESQLSEKQQTLSIDRGGGKRSHPVQQALIEKTPGKAFSHRAEAGCHFKNTSAAVALDSTRLFVNHIPRKCFRTVAGTRARKYRATEGRRKGRRENRSILHSVKLKSGGSQTLQGHSYRQAEHRPLVRAAQGQRQCALRNLQRCTAI